MPADITITNGEAEMMYTGKMPWHTLGRKLDGPATSEEAIRAAGLDWTVELAPVYAKLPNPPFVEYASVRNRRAVYREDTGNVLGVVGSSYTPVQNREAFAFFDSVVGQKAAMFHTAGSLAGGKRIWMLAKVPDDIVVAGHDVTELYLLLTNAHDGLRAIEIAWTPIRVVCQNTLSLALHEATKRIHILHRPSVRERIQEARDILGFVTDGAGTLSLQFNRLAEIPLSPAAFAHYLDALYPVPAKPATPADEPIYERAVKRVAGERDAVTALFEGGRGNDDPRTKRTLWTAYNAVVEHVDHALAYAQKRDTDAALSYIWFGGGADFKRRAFDVAGRVAFAGQPSFAM
jgi:phage/plasmid-like protein (TIGR03299 family)